MIGRLLEKRKKSCLVLFTAMLLHSSSSRFPSFCLQHPYKRVFWLSSSDLSLELAIFRVSYFVSRSGGMLLARAKIHGAFCGNFAQATFILLERDLDEFSSPGTSSE